MHINVSEKNSKKILSLTKQFAGFGQNYLTYMGSDKSSSIKKLINAFLFVPVIIPTGVTISLVACAYFFIDAVSAKPNDSTISKLVKGLLKLPIYVIAAIILIPCVILNLVVSLIPFLIFLTINKNIANDKENSVQINDKENSVQINDKENSAQINDKENSAQIEVGNDDEYNESIKKESAKFTHDENSLSTEKHEDNQALISNYEYPQTVEIISQNTGSEENIDQTTIISGINNQNVKDGKAMVRVVSNNSNVTMKGIITGDARGRPKAAAFAFECQTVPDGLDLQFGYKMRTGGTQVEAAKKLMQDESVRTMLSGNGGILAIEQSRSTNVAIE